MFQMKTLLACLQKVRTSNFFEVGILWASLATVLLFYGALIPLLPVYVQSLSGNQTKSSIRHGYNVSEANKTQSHTTRVNSVITGSLIGLAQWTEFGSNFVIGPLVDKIGYDVPLFVGYSVVVISSIGFSFAKSYATLVIWRALEGVGAASVITSGTAIVADIYRHNDEERGKMIGIVLCGMSIGLSVGPPFGSLLYAIGEASTPFVAIAVITSVLALLQLWVRTPKIQRKDSSEPCQTAAAQLRLIRDPYILMCALLIWLGYLGLSFLEGTLPFHMLTDLGTESWMTGAVFVPLNVAFGVSFPILAWLSARFGRWPVMFVSYILGALGLIGYGFFSSFSALLVLGLPIGIIQAVIAATVFPLMAYLVDTRVGETVYGTAFAIANIAMTASFGSGPILGGALNAAVGFSGSMFIVAGLTLVALIPLGLLRKPIMTGESNDETVNLLPKDDLFNGGKLENTQNDCKILVP